MNVLSEAAHRTLAYIALVNRGGSSPSRKAVREFFRSAGPRRSTWPLSERYLEVYRALSAATLGGESEHPVDYLMRMEWAEERSSGVFLTPVGLALVRALDAAEQEHDDVIEAVLDVDDPFAYTKAVAYLRTDSPALLVDPYLRMTQLIELDRVPSVSRVLVGRGLKQEELGDLGRAAQVVAARRPFDVRQSKTLHDRYLIPEHGGVLMLGGSLNTIGRAPITLTTLSPDLSDVVRKQHEEMWASATPVKPPTEAEDEPSTSED